MWRWDRHSLNDSIKGCSCNIGWDCANIIASFLDPNVSDKEFYINGFDDRMVTQNGTKDAIRLLNKWYNMGLMWDDFALYGSGDTTGADMIKAGYVGSFMQNWDMPFRNAEDSYNANIFFPVTNDEVLASLLYLDYISNPETIKYLQAGDEGVTHEVLDSGAIQIIAAIGDAIQNSGKNIDYTITCNGTYFGDQKLAELSLAYSYAGIDPQLVTLSSGAQDIMDERAEKWEEYFGSSDMLP